MQFLLLALLTTILCYFILYLHFQTNGFQYILNLPGDIYYTYVLTSISMMSQSYEQWQLPKISSLEYT